MLSSDCHTSMYVVVKMSYMFRHVEQKYRERFLMYPQCVLIMNF